MQRYQIIRLPWLRSFRSLTFITDSINMETELLRDVPILIGEWGAFEGRIIGTGSYLRCYTMQSRG